MSYKHYIVYPNDFKDLNVLKANINDYTLFVHGGSFFNERPRRSYYEILLVKNLHCKLFKDFVIDDKLTPNRIMLYGINLLLKNFQDKKRIVIVTGVPLGFETAINKQKGTNFKYLNQILNTIETKKLIVTIYSIPQGTNNVIDIINNYNNYGLIKV